MPDFDQQPHAADPRRKKPSLAQADSFRGSPGDVFRALMMQMFLQHLEVIEEFRRLHERWGVPYRVRSRR